MKEIIENNTADRFNTNFINLLEDLIKKTK